MREVMALAETGAAASRETARREVVPPTSAHPPSGESPVDHPSFGFRPFAWVQTRKMREVLGQPDLVGIAMLAKLIVSAL